MRQTPYSVVQTFFFFLTGCGVGGVHLHGVKTRVCADEPPPCRCRCKPGSVVTRDDSSHSFFNFFFPFFFRCTLYLVFLSFFFCVLLNVVQRLARVSAVDTRRVRETCAARTRGLPDTRLAPPPPTDPLRLLIALSCPTRVLWEAPKSTSLCLRKRLITRGDWFACLCCCVSCVVLCFVLPAVDAPALPSSTPGIGRTTS